MIRCPIDHRLPDQNCLTVAVQSVQRFGHQEEPRNFRLSGLTVGNGLPRGEQRQTWVWRRAPRLSRRQIQKLLRRRIALCDPRFQSNRGRRPVLLRDSGGGLLLGDAPRGRGTTGRHTLRQTGDICLRVMLEARKIKIVGMSVRKTKQDQAEHKQNAHVHLAFPL